MTSRRRQPSAKASSADHPERAAPERLLTAKQAAEMLASSPRGVWRLRASGALHGIVIAGVGTRFRLSDVQRLIRQAAEGGCGHA